MGSAQKILWFARTCLMVLGMLAGCGYSPNTDYGAVELVSAYGRVTLDGQPLDGATVTFEMADGQFSYGRTDAKGDYTLQFDSVRRGVTLGEKTVRISTASNLAGLHSTVGIEVGESNSEEDAGRTQLLTAERVPEMYNTRSMLKALVTTSQREFNFELRSKSFIQPITD